MANDIGDIEHDAPATRTEFAQQLVALRNRSKYSYRQLAELIGSSTTTVHGWINGRHLPFPRDNEAFAELLTVLGVNDVEPWLSTLTDLRSTSATAASNPYVGLRSFNRDDAARFFGRDDDIEALGQRLHRYTERPPQTALIITGPSGVGKSSLVNVVLASVAESVGRVITEIEAAHDGEFGASHAPVNEQVILIDQAEQLFSRRDRIGAFSRIEQWIKEGRHVVLTVRSDFIEECLTEPVTASALQADAYYVQPLNRDVLSEVVLGPAAQAVRTIEPALVVNIVDDFGELVDGRAQVGALPLLSFVLHEMAERSNAAITRSTYEEIGGLSGALETVAERAYSELTEPGKNAAERLFLELVQTREYGEPTRRIASVEPPARIAPEAYDEAINRFIQTGLIVATDEGLTVAHEAMFSSWPRLHRWIEESRDIFTSYEHLAAQTQNWLRSGKDPDALLTGTPLSAAKQVLASPLLSDRLTRDQRAFVAQGEVALDANLEQERRRVRSFRTVAVVALAAALVAAGFLVKSTHDASRARTAENAAISRELSLLSYSLEADNQLLAGQVAATAHQVHPTSESESELINLGARVPVGRFMSSPTTVAVATSTDGQLAAYSDPIEGTITVVELTDPTTRQWSERAVIDVGEDTYALAISPTKRYLAAGGLGVTARVWDLSADTPTPIPIQHGLPLEVAIQSMAFGPDNELLVSGSGPEVVRLTLDGTSVDRLAGIKVDTVVWSVDISDDGATYALARDDGVVELWSAEPLEKVTELDAELGARAVAVDIAPSGSILAVGYQTDQFKVWDLTSTPPTDVTPDEQGFTTWVNSVRFSPDEKLLAAGSADSTIRTWHTGDWYPAGPELRNPANVIGVRWAHDHQLFAGVANGQVSVWDLGAASFFTLGSGVWSIDHSNDQSLLATSGARIAIHDDFTEPAQGWEYFTFDSDPESPNHFSSSSEGAISPDGQWVYLGGRDGNIGRTRTGDNAPGSPVEIERTYSGLTALVEQVSVSPDGRFVAGVADDNQLGVWDTDLPGDSPIHLAELDGLGLAVEFSPDSSLVAAGTTAHDLVIFDLSSPTSPQQLSQVTVSDSNTFAIDFHPTEPVIATGSDDALVRLWDISDPTEPQQLGEPLAGAYSRVYSVRFSADGMSLAAGASDALVWDVSDVSSPELTAKFVPRAVLYSVDFSPDARRLVGGDANGEIYIWELDVNAVVNRLCQQSIEGITETEWTRYLSALPDYRPPCG